MSVNHAVAATHHWQRAARQTLTQYHWGAHRRTTTTAARWRIATRWWDHARAAHTYYVNHPLPRWAIPSWFAAKLPCLARAEEYGPPWEGGYATSASFFGMVYSVSSYAHGGPEVAAVYGNDWRNVPWDAASYVVYHTWSAVGSSGWPNTAPGCGL